jgi:Raf kinase inhibitor-like YbhB/YbcL family protein
MIKNKAVANFILVIGVLATGARLFAAEEPFKLGSSAMVPGAPIGVEYTCTGANRSPPLAWGGLPKSTASFALIMSDPDAPGGTFIHWVAYNIPPTTSSLPAGVPRTSAIPGGGTNGANGVGQIGYKGPCPPPGKVHHYHFRLYAVDSKLNLGDGADASAVESAIRDRVVGSADLMVTFSR